MKQAKTNATMLMKQQKQDQDQQQRRYHDIIIFSKRIPFKSIQ